MEQRLSMITLGVADLKRAVAFYEKVIGGRSPQARQGSGGLSFVSRPGHISARAVLWAIGPARDCLFATEVEIGVTRITDRPETLRSPIS